MAELRRYVIGLGDGDVLRLERLAKRYGMTESQFIRALLIEVDDALTVMEEASMNGDSRVDTIEEFVRELMPKRRDDIEEVGVVGEGEGER